MTKKKRGELRYIFQFKGPVTQDQVDDEALAIEKLLEKGEDPFIVTGPHLDVTDLKTGITTKIINRGCSCGEEPDKLASLLVIIYAVVLMLLAAKAAGVIG